MTATDIIQVALPVPRGEAYDYLCDRPLAPGQRVRVPFGPRRLVGMVVARGAGADLPRSRLKAVREVIDATPLVDAGWLDLLRFAAAYYQAPLGMAIATALPASLRKGRAAVPLATARWAPTAAGRETPPAALARAPRQADVLKTLMLAAEPLGAAELGSGAGRALAALEARGLVQRAASAPAPRETVPPPVLTDEQAAACESIRGNLSHFRCHLLDGVTGSGKTEVYLTLAGELAQRGRQTLMLVPEIGLTPQMVQRVAARTGARIAVLHSGLADGERHNAWMAARSGEADIVLGTRSAVFVPLARPGLVVVDEEHDGSFKQQDGMRYHARDLAIRRAQQWGVPAVLGSATPSLESLHNAAQGRYAPLHLTRRYGGAELPRVRVIDLRGQRCPDGLSAPLIQSVGTHLGAGNQVLLFLNRRGYAPVLLCHACGWTAVCQRCDARLIMHKRSGTLRCHHCDHRRPLPPRCPDCGATELHALGQGTERIEQRAAELWPDVQRLRIDRDVLGRKGELEAALDAARQGEAQLLIGTQMLAKGHDFPGLSLAAIVDADQGLYGQDFRAAEQLAQLVTQVAGRAGRRAERGEVLLQTHNPDHPLLENLNPGDYPGTARRLLEERRLLGWPPYSRLALIRAEAPRPETASDVLDELAATIPADTPLEVLGPAPAAMERRAGQYRFHLLLRSDNWRPLQAQLQLLRRELEARPSARQIRWSIDVDPQFLD